MQILNKQILYIISSFVAGFSLMTIELISSRIMAPIIGSSVYTWTSVIGITLLGLAIGSYFGGKIADRIETDRPLPLAFLISAVLVAIIPTLTQYTDFIVNLSNSILKLNLLLSIYLFLLPTCAIGLIQPMILKKYADDFSKISSKYGILSAVWSIGSVLGVFSTGFFFISNIGSRETLWLMSIVLFLVGIIFIKKDKKLFLLFLATAMILPAMIYTTQQNTINKKIIYQKETSYYNAKVADINLPVIGESRVLFLDFDSHSVESKQVSEYLYPEIYPVFASLKDNIEKILTIGAGAYTMPKYFKNYYKNAEISVIEIDEEMINIGNTFFDLKKYDVKTIVGDAKVVIKKNQEKYDVIFGDAYNSFISVPWYLLTKEWNEEIKQKLNKNGIYAINFIGTIAGEKSKFTESVLNTFKNTFPNFYIFGFGSYAEGMQNIVLIGINGDLPINEKDLARKLALGKNSFLADKIIPVEFFEKSTSKILTNNFSPTEKLMAPIIENYFSRNLLQLKRMLQ